MTDQWHAVRWVLSGQVQGVGFRYYARQVAEGMGVLGWVRNLPDGTVEVQAAGSADQLAAFREHLRQGPRAARVEGIDEDELVQIPRWQSFRIVF